MYAPGLYEESHGVVANNMYDPHHGLTFSLTYSGPDTNASLWWDGAEPIWVTAVKNGLKAGKCGKKRVNNGCLGGLLDGWNGRLVNG